MPRCTSVCIMIFALLIYWTNSTKSSPHLTTGGILPTPSIRVKEWLTNYNAGLEILRKESALALWNNLLDPGPFTAKRLERAHAKMAVWQRKKTPEAESLWHYWTEMSELLQTSKTDFSLEKRMLRLITRGPRYTAALARSLSSLVSRMREIYQGVSVELRNTTYRTERDFNHLMRTCHNPKTLELAWNEWHLAVGPPIRPLFAQAVEVMNQAARLGGYQDMGAVWRAELDLNEGVDARTLITRLFDHVAPLFALLHAHVRHALRKKYGPDLVGIREPIPAHLLGDLWGQNWEALADLIYPETEDTKDKERMVELSRVTTRDLVKEANNFFGELGFPDLPKSFWSLSVLGISESPPNATCHSRALDMYAPDDYRLLFCEGVSAEGFEAAFHELGHIHYFHAYSRQPTVFRDGANSAAHETMGDAIQLAAVAAASQKTINKSSGKKPDEMRHLLKTALKKLPLLAFARVVDEWRWDVFQGKITNADYNRAWWLMKRRYQGVMPPSPRMEQFFDPGAKFHIPDNTPYIRYFIAVVAQFQVLKHLCEVSDNSAPLHSCNIAQSKVAGELLRDAMSRGSSISWNELLRVLTGSPRLDATPLLEYFDPLTQRLLREAERKNITVGW